MPETSFVGGIPHASRSTDFFKLYVLALTRQPALRRELELLNRALERLYPFAEDLALASQPDLQGSGGAGGRGREA